MQGRTGAGPQPAPSRSSPPRPAPARRRPEPAPAHPGVAPPPPGAARDPLLDLVDPGPRRRDALRHPDGAPQVLLGRADQGAEDPPQIEPQERQGPLRRYGLRGQALST